MNPVLDAIFRTIPTRFGFRTTRSFRRLGGYHCSATTICRGNAPCYGTTTSCWGCGLTGAWAGFLIFISIAEVSPKVTFSPSKDVRQSPVRVDISMSIRDSRTMHRQFSLLSGWGWSIRWRGDSHKYRYGNRWKGRRGHFLFGRGQTFQWVVLEHLELVHDSLSVKVNVEDIGELLHEYLCHLDGSHHHTVVLGLQHRSQVTSSKNVHINTCKVKECLEGHLLLRQGYRIVQKPTHGWCKCVSTCQLYLDTLISFRISQRISALQVYTIISQQCHLVQSELVLIMGVWTYSVW